MAKLLNILYFDPGSGKWGRGKPQRSSPQPAHTTVSVAVVDFEPETLTDEVAASRAKHLTEALRARAPAVIALNGVSEPMLRAVLSLDWIRGSYATHEPAPQSALLWHVQLPVHLAESFDRPQCTAINLRKFHGADGIIRATNFLGSAETRGDEANLLVSRGLTDGTTLLLFNPYKSGTASVAVTDAMSRVRMNTGFIEDLSTPPLGPTVWTRAHNLVSTGIASISSDAFSSCVIATFAPRAAVVLNTTEDTPTPASVGSGKADSQAVFPSTPSDPSGKDRRRVWSSKHSSAIRVRDGTDEVYYDLTPYFPKSEDAIKALNSNHFGWAADYAILHGRLLAVHGQNADIPAFRQYMTAHPPPTRPVLSGVQGALPNAAPREADKQRRGKDPNNFSPYCLLTPTLSATRRRVWSAHRAVLLHQVTPREMKFDITELIGVGPNALNIAIDRLNGQHRLGMKQPTGKMTEDLTAAAESKEQEGGRMELEEDLLHSYRFDYALLYSADRHGYWLVAAVDVPCDIAPCRVAAKALPSSVVAILETEAGVA
jgi:hypothetical protein